MRMVHIQITEQHLSLARPFRNVQLFVALGTLLLCVRPFMDSVFIFAMTCILQITVLVGFFIGYCRLGRKCHPVYGYGIVHAIIVHCDTIQR